MQRAPAPKSLLGRHRLLSATASVYVSPICLGAMSLGSQWKGIMGDCSKDNAFEILDTFHDLGGNFIDTANIYQGGESEAWIGEWMAKTPGRRDEMVVATKYSLAPVPQRGGITSNYGGTGSKALHVAVGDSLKRLKTDYIDLFYVHIYDYATDIPELMQSLNALVQRGQVLYLGISDTPAWWIVKANCYARQHGLRQFSVYQGRYSAQLRDLERDVIPMCEAEGMGIAPWNVVGSGSFRASDAGPKQGGRASTRMATGREAQVSLTLEKVAQRLGYPIVSIAIAYVLHKAPYMFPVVGGSKAAYIKTNAEALGIRLSEQDIAEIESGYAFEPGFPHDLATMAGKVARGPEDIASLANMGHFDHVPRRGIVTPHVD